MTSDANHKQTESVADAVCLACGCLCDDIRLSLQGGRIAAAERACPIGQQWFLASRPAEAPVCTIDGDSAPLDESLEKAAGVLASAKQVLIFGLAGATCEAQRRAVALADRLGATIVAATSATAKLATAMQSGGMVTASLGEVRHRADLVIFWGVDPATTHPRHFERYSLDCRGAFVPRGRADRTCVVVDTKRTPTADAADVFLQIAPGGHEATLAALQQIVLGAYQPKATDVVRESHVGSAQWQDLVERMKTARYGALFFEPNQFADSLLSLVRELNRHTRFVALPLGAAANSAGGPQVMAWQTGFGTAVDFSDGYPQYVDDLSIESALATGRADTALIVAADPLADPIASLSEAARASLAAIPSVVLQTADWKIDSLRPTVSLTVATPGIGAGGSVFRSDGIALPLRPVVRSAYPSAKTILAELEKRIQKMLSHTP